MSTKSDYVWRVAPRPETESALVMIVDCDFGNRSVTNDIENVVATIARVLPPRANGYEWLYRDSQGDWDRVNQFTFRISAGPRDGLMEKIWVAAAYANGAKGQSE